MSGIPATILHRTVDHVAGLSSGALALTNYQWGLAQLDDVLCTFDAYGTMHQFYGATALGANFLSTSGGIVKGVIAFQNPSDSGGNNNITMTATNGDYVGYSTNGIYGNVGGYAYSYAHDGFNQNGAWGNLNVSGGNWYATGPSSRSVDLGLGAGSVHPQLYMTYLSAAATLSVDSGLYVSDGTNNASLRGDYGLAINSGANCLSATPSGGFTGSGTAATMALGVSTAGFFSVTGLGGTSSNLHLANTTGHIADLYAGTSGDYLYIANAAHHINLSTTDLQFDGTSIFTTLAPKASPTFTGIVSGVTAAMIGLGNVTNVAQVPLSYMGIASGVATLDAGGHIPAAQLPSSILGAMIYQAAWNASTNTPTIPTASAANKGFYWIVSVAGSTSEGGITDWKVGDWIVSDGTTWDKIDNTDAISSWNGRTGAIIPAAGDYTAAQITNALDSSATLTAHSVWIGPTSGSGAGSYRALATADLPTITFVGTIASGVWNGTPIGDAYITSAATWNAKAPTASPTLTGTLTLNTATLDNNTTANVLRIRGTGYSTGIEIFPQSATSERILAYDRTVGIFSDLILDAANIYLQTSSTQVLGLSASAATFSVPIVATGLTGSFGSVSFPAGNVSLSAASAGYVDLTSQNAVQNTFRLIRGSTLIGSVSSYGATDPRFNVYGYTGIVFETPSVSTGFTFSLDSPSSTPLVLNAAAATFAVPTLLTTGSSAITSGTMTVGSTQLFANTVAWASATMTITVTGIAGLRQSIGIVKGSATAISITNTVSTSWCQTGTGGTTTSATITLNPSSYPNGYYKLLLEWVSATVCFVSLV